MLREMEKLTFHLDVRGWGGDDILELPISLSVPPFTCSQPELLEGVASTVCVKIKFPLYMVLYYGRSTLKGAGH